MNIATAVKPAPSVRDHSRYILRRVADCLVRENYREIALGTVIPAERAPFDRLIAPTDHYLAYEAADGGTLFMPVEPDGFMQTWRVCAPPFVHVARQGARLIDSVTEFLEIMKAGLEGEDSGNVSAFLDECQAAIEQGAIDTSTPAGRAMFSMLSVFSEFERSILRERIMVGLARSRSEGKRSGRPPLDPVLTEKIKRSLAKGVSINATARTLKVGVATVHRLKQQMTQAA